MEEVSDRVRRRLREEMARRHMSQRDVAGILGWTQSRVAKLLLGRRRLSVDDMAALCFAMSLSITEVIRDHGLEFVAEMTPTELRFFTAFREASEPMREAFMTLLGVRAKTSAPERHAGSKPGFKLGKPRNHSSRA